MLVECADKYRSAQFYDESNMMHWKAATEGMFPPVESISKNRYFPMIAPDSKFAVHPVTCFSAGTALISGKSAPFFSERSLIAAAEGVMERFLRKIVTRSIASDLKSEIGTGSMPGAPEKLIPSTGEAGFQVRIFMKERPGDLLYIEQRKWHRNISASELNVSLNNLKPYYAAPGAVKEFYGKKTARNRDTVRTIRADRECAK